jgi:hypothetical protein
MTEAKTCNRVSSALTLPQRPAQNTHSNLAFLPLNAIQTEGLLAKQF